MSTIRTLKFLLVVLTVTCLIFTISFMTACKPDASVEKTMPVKEEAEETTKEETEAEEPEEADEEEPEEEAEEEAIKIESSSFKNNEAIPSDYTCDGKNINPALIISGVPANAESLVLIMDDPDSPGGTWVHWTIWNIDPKTKGIPENNVPAGAVEGVTDFGTPGYGGPCPPPGTHRYFFKLYALDIMLDLDTSATARDIQEAMQGHILDSTELIGLYGNS